MLNSVNDTKHSFISCILKPANTVYLPDGSITLEQLHRLLSNIKYIITGTMKTENGILVFYPYDLEAGKISEVPVLMGEIGRLYYDIMTGDLYRSKGRMYMLIGSLAELENVPGHTVSIEMLNTSVSQLTEKINEFYTAHQTVDVITSQDDGFDILYASGAEVTLPVRARDGIIADVNETNDFIDIRLEDTVLTDINHANREIKNIYTILGETVTGTEEVSQAYDTRQTADGMDIIDGALARVERIQGETVKSSNLIPFPYTDGGVGGVKTTNGITFTINADGSVTAKGTATSTAYFNLCKVDFGEENAWGMNGTTVNGLSFKNCNYDSNNKVSSINVSTGTTVDTTYYPMVNAGPTARPYRPYFSGLKNAYFEGVKSTNADGTKESEFSLYSPIELGKWDYIDFERQKIVRGTNTVIFTGNESWLRQGTGANDYGIYSYQASILPSKSTNVGICNRYNVRSSSFSNATEDGCMPHTAGYAYFRTKSYTTVNEWKAHLAELYANGNPLILSYELATPTEEDIDIPTNKYTAWNGGSETVIQGETDNSADGAMPKITQIYVVKRGTSV